MAAEIACPACGSANEAGRKFCGECGSGLARECPACGTPNPSNVKFCGECGAALATTSAPQPATASTPAAERRLVSVLFADLVGFTAASEDRDPEETRELLSRYFEEARTLIERYGGTIEKFIGDAVMAVWGAPVAQEDDAERAVRAALDLVAAVPELHPALQARAAVLTGEAAVTLGAEGQGMVAGDLVNTASRVQSVAEPGTVLVGEATRRASEAAIAYEPAGEHELKGKAEPAPLWRALRVVASRGGEGRSVGLEAPFVGRDHELRLVKDLFHATADEERARVVSVLGVAGIGKSRLSWEFEKYIDGLLQNVWWHRGRCLAYGDGVAYWALAEMVRGRIRALEDDDPSTTAAKLETTLAEHFADAGERRWIEERLRHLIGLSDRAAADREDLFPAWRRFFERLAEQSPLVLVFEDLHWADAGLVSFIDHLLDWSRTQPIFVLALARPEIAERHPGFPGATRSATTLPLEPLPDEAVDELLRGLVPGFPEDVRARIRERADGVPLYAVETVRMLLDRGVLEPAGSEYRLVGGIDTLEVPETLHALIAARLDGLPEAERRVLQDASVLGKTFTPRGLSALSGLSDDELGPLLTSLVRKEVLYLETDPRSAARGSYGFLQALIQRIAYETLSRRERRGRHLAAAAFLARDSGMDPSEIAEVIAAHYLDAYRADESAADASDVKSSARGWFVRAAERAGSLAAAGEAQRGFERAAALADDDGERADLLYRAGEAARMDGDPAAAERLLLEAIAIFERAGKLLEEARASASLGDSLYTTGRLEEAIERMKSSLALFEERDDDPAAATVSAQLARFLFFAGDPEGAVKHNEHALALGERLRLPDVVSHALNTKALVLENRPHESLALMRGALALAREHDLGNAATRGFINLGYLLWITGAPGVETELITREGIAYARRRGDRAAELALVGQLTSVLYEEGRWDELEELVAEFPEDAIQLGDAVGFQLPYFRACIAMWRGDAASVRALMQEWAELRLTTSDLQLRTISANARALLVAADGRHEEALRITRDELARATNPNAVEGSLETGGESAAVLGSADALSELLDLAERADVAVPPSSVAQRARLRARLAAMCGDADAPFEPALAILREIGQRLWLAVTLLDQAEWLVANGRAADAVDPISEARETFDELRVTWWSDRLERVEASVHAGAAAT